MTCLENLEGDYSYIATLVCLARAASSVITVCDSVKESWTLGLSIHSDKVCSLLSCYNVWRSTEETGGGAAVSWLLLHLQWPQTTPLQPFLVPTMPGAACIRGTGRPRPAESAFLSLPILSSSHTNTCQWSGRSPGCISYRPPSEGLSLCSSLTMWTDRRASQLSHLSQYFHSPQNSPVLARLLPRMPGATCEARRTGHALHNLSELSSGHTRSCWRRSRSLASSAL